MEAATVTRLFGKCFEIVNDSRWTLPDGVNWFAEKSWKIEVLENLKNDLNDVKSKLNDYHLGDWSTHTTQMNKAGYIVQKVRKEIQAEFVTQAWTKFYEIVSSFPLVPAKSLEDNSLASVHLCEAPGAFVTSLNHWLKLNAPAVRWNWLATSLNPHYEGNSVYQMISDDRLILYTPDNWYFGLDDTGDLMDLKNLDATAERAGKNVMLVTADGSVNCVDVPAEQEEVVSQLLYCEVITALHLLARGGNFLLKAFTMFEHRTVCLMYLLCCCFDQVIVNKPVTSKAGNSEVYIVCLGFAGQDFLAPFVEILRRNFPAFPAEIAMFRRSDIPDSFIEQIASCGAFFKDHQCEVILNNIRTYGADVTADVSNIKRIVAKEFIKQYKLRPLPPESKLVKKAQTFYNYMICGEYMKGRGSLDSYNSRRQDKQQTKQLGPKDRLAVIVVDLESIVKPKITRFALNGTPTELSIKAGKPYSRIMSSRFCEQPILKMYINVIDIIEDIGFEDAIPSERAIDEFTRENAGVTRKVVNFGYVNNTDSHGLITKVCEALDNLEENQTLTLLGYPLLSRLSVGILYVLAETFDYFELQPCDELGCVINLERYVKVTKIADFLRNIFQASVEAERKGAAILSVLPVSTLCDPTRYHNIVNINHWVIRQNARIVANYYCPIK